VTETTANEDAISMFERREIRSSITSKTTRQTIREILTIQFLDLLNDHHDEPTDYHVSPFTSLIALFELDDGRLLQSAIILDISIIIVFNTVIIIASSRLATSLDFFDRSCRSDHCYSSHISSFGSRRTRT
jgi:hypothetical protein